MKLIRVDGLKIACGKEIFIPFDSEHPERGGSTMACGDGIFCQRCAEHNKEVDSKGGRTK